MVIRLKKLLTATLGVLLIVLGLIFFVLQPVRHGVG